MYLIKFSISNSSRIPSWVRKSERAEIKQLDARHAMQAKKDGVDGFVLAEIGRIREGRVDTGLTAGQKDLVQAGLFHKMMEACNHKLVDIHRFVHRREGKTTKYVLVFVYDEGEDKKELILSKKQRSSLEFFTQAVWKYCHVWLNDSNVTVNFTSLAEKNVKPQLKLAALHNGHVGLTFETTADKATSSSAKKASPEAVSA